MAALDRITISLPRKIIAELDKLSPNRSRLIAEAVQRDLERRRHEAFLLSLTTPHTEARVIAEQGLGSWLTDGTPGADVDLLASEAGTAVHWSAGTGWEKDPS